jgi:signal peptidase I
LTRASGDKRASRARSAEERGGRPEAGGRSELREWGKTLVLTVLLLVVIRLFFVQTFVITSGSMEDTLLVGDFLMANRLAFGSRLPGTHVSTPGYSHPHRGDIVVFESVTEEGLKIVKRLIGMPGDTLGMRDKHLFRNGERQEEPYVKWEDPSGDQEDPSMNWQRDYLAPGVDPSTYHPTRDNWGPIVVPDGYYFMMGDNRDDSLDSRYWGLVDRWRLEGRVMFLYFSYDSQSLEPFAFLREIRWNRIGDRIR